MYTPCVNVDCVEVDTKITKTYNIQSENNTLIPYTEDLLFNFEESTCCNIRHNLLSRYKQTSIRHSF